MFLPKDVLSLVFAFLPDTSRGTVARVCREWREVALRRVPRWHPAVFRFARDMFRAIEQGNEAFYDEFAGDALWDISRAFDSDSFYTKRSPLQVGVEAGQVNMLRRMRADPNFEHESCLLICAISHRQAAVCTWLLDDEGSDISERSDGYDGTDSPLFWAAASSDAALCRLVLEHPRAHAVMAECKHNYVYEMARRAVDHGRMENLDFVLNLFGGLGLSDATMRDWLLRSVECKPELKEFLEKRGLFSPLQ